MRRRAKIGATLGPACDDEWTLEEMVRSGLDVARLNFSHGTHAEHRQRAKRLARVARRAGRSVALLADLQGPRFRVGVLPDGTRSVARGEIVELAAGGERSPRAGAIPVAYPALADVVRPGARILVDDGRVELCVRGIRGSIVRCVVERGGEISDHKGINLPGSALSAPALTAKDRRDLRFAVEIGADWLAVSFVRRAEDIRLARRLLRAAGSEIPVMAKIERPEAVAHLDAILAEADGLLVARGDLGVELPPQEVPILQKQIVDAANAAGKPVVTATQMLESMRHAARPTRAEASDVANAVLDGSDCLLLTAETAAGEYPVQAVEMMARIIEQAESSGRGRRPHLPATGFSVPEATCLAGCRAAFEVHARFLAVFTQSGFSARQAARYRPRTPILAFAATAGVARQLSMVWGVDPRRVAPQRTVEQMISALDRALLEEKLAARNDLVVLLAGTPVGVSGTTNLMEIHRVGAPVRTARVTKKRPRSRAAR